MEPKSASAGLTRWIVLASAFTCVASVLLLRDGQPDGDVAQNPRRPEWRPAFRAS
jgi:hypothetical protein